MSKFAWCLAALLCVHESPAQENALEIETQSNGKYHAVWPAGPTRDSLPAWAAPGKIRFSRWDGGRIETAKAFLSGWEGLNPPDPDLLYTMTNWYDLKTVRLLKEAHINVIWITLSVGFSIETEAAHRQDVARYIAECHRQGIHVMAYESVSNVFWEDMFEQVPASKNWIQRGRDGKPAKYGAGRYDKMGRITRYLADLSNPDWQAYLRKRIDLAIESGADGIMYDNGKGEKMFDLFPALMKYASGRKRDFVMMVNFHWSNFVLHRTLNAMTTEDGMEPGLWPPSAPGYVRIKPHYKYLMPMADTLLVNNIGMLRIHEALSDGWKPAMIEDGHREYGGRLESLMSPAHSQLALAENMMFNVALEQFVEARPAHALLTGKKEALDSWRAVGKYNQFFEEHQDLYLGARSVAPLAVIIDDRGEGVPLLDGLSSRRVLFNVLYERDVTPKALAGYKAVAALTTSVLRASAISAMEEFARTGGKLIVSAGAGALDEMDKPRARPAFPGALALEKLPPPDDLAKMLLAASGEGLAHLEAPLGILYNVTGQTDRRRILVHLLNYTVSPMENLTLKMSGEYRAARLVSPDNAGSFVKPPRLGSGAAELEIPKVSIYSVVVLDRK